MQQLTRGIKPAVSRIGPDRKCAPLAQHRKRILVLKRLFLYAGFQQLRADCRRKALFQSKLRPAIRTLACKRRRLLQNSAQDRILHACGGRRRKRFLFARLYDSIQSQFQIHRFSPFQIRQVSSCASRRMKRPPCTERCII